MSEFVSDVEAVYAAFGADEGTAETAAQRIAAFREDHDEDVTPEDVENRLEESPYDDASHAHDWVVGDFAAECEDCTDSREYRLTGFDETAADPTQGA